MSEWQPIETAPRDGTHVLLYAEKATTEAWWDKEGFFWDYVREEAGYGKWELVRLSPHGCGCCSSELTSATHWMPLPEAPK